jgi:hypothetical protein
MLSAGDRGKVMGTNDTQEVESLLRGIEERKVTKAKEGMGAFATFVWIGSGIYLYATAEGVTFFSWSALAFFVVGMFVAAALFGLAIYLTLKFAAFEFEKLVGAPTPLAGKFLQLVSAVIGLAWGVAIFISASCAFNLIEGGREQAWIVVDMEKPSGEATQMAFNNPGVPDMTLAECQASIARAGPTLEAAIQADPRVRGSRIRSARCVMSAGDPLRPTT